MIDTHAHVHDRSFDDDRDAMLARARERGVDAVVTVGCDVEDSRRACEVAERYSLAATIGVHPHEAKDGIDGLEALLAEPEVVAVGECGFDLHYEHSPLDAQREVFAAQVELALEHDLALVIHTREAWAETFDLLGATGVPERTIFHCFTGGPDEARRCLDLGAHLSFSGIVTFKTAEDLRAAASICPIDRLLVETDSPYLAPVPHRGKPNRPALVPLVGAAVAVAQGTAPEAIAEATWANAEAVYRLA